MIRDFQNATFNRTGRRGIPAAAIESEFGSGKVRIRAVKSGSWREGLDDALLAKAQVHFDVSSLLYHVRQTLSNAVGVLDKAWKGVEMVLPPELIEGKYRVKLQVTIVLPRENGDGGRILAQSGTKVVIPGEGDGGEGGDETGRSLLPVKPRHGMSELWRLEFTASGPILFVNADLEEISFRELATHSAFKYGILPGALRLIFFRLAMADPDTASWEEPWLRLPGAAGRARPELDELEFSEQIAMANEWADEVVAAVSTKAEVVSKFASKWNAEKADA